jgi:ABC-type polysaccharide/polyol phosphate transport system ATPase subunit/SAM-dependent methyltransferase
LLIESKISGATVNPAGAAPTLIRLERVSVEYRAPRERIATFKEYVIRLVQRRVRHDVFKALREVSLEISQGEVFGIIGHNGAGKSTLLKVVSRVLKPTHGRVWVKGRIAPLLELGAGFHPELSGRENVFLNGTLLGYSRTEVQALFDEIVDFADVWDFIDAPLRTYSTGMAARLGFAVATATRPDILLVDEVLSVGDERFQEKCGARMKSFRDGGTSTMLVTHSPQLVEKMCDRVAWLDRGEVRAIDKPHAVIKQYHDAYSTKAVSQAALVPSPKSSVTSSKPGPKPEMTALEEEALEKQWYYHFDLPCGAKTQCILPPEIARYHDDRLAMMNSVLEPLFAQSWEQTSCLDIGSNEGYFSVKLAERGCAQVLGVEARPENIAGAELIRQVYGYPNLSFRHATLTPHNQAEFGQFDVVLLFGLLFSLEDPIGMLRTARALTKRVLLIETLIAPEVGGHIPWGVYPAKKELQGSFALIDQRAEMHLLACSLTGLSLCPGREALLWLLEQLGFARVEVVPPPPGAYEELTTGQRMMIAAYV